MFRNSSLTITVFLFTGLFFFQFISSQSQELPQRSLRSKFRIQVIETEGLNSDSLKQIVSFIRDELKINTFHICNKGKDKILAGDFPAKDYARYQLTRIKKIYPRAKIVCADNAFVVCFQLYEKEKKIRSIKKDADAITKNLLITEDQEPKLSYNPNNEISFEAWYDKRYFEANTAVSEEYLTEQEKEVFYYLNLLRMNPPLFANTYFLKHTGNPDDEYEISLFEALRVMDPLPILKPNIECWESAKCHAIASGVRGYVGHNRENCKPYFWGECCQYGPSDPIAIILQLLIDRGIPSLGHRKIFLGSYTELGVSIQPHCIYGSNAVLDFR